MATDFGNADAALQASIFDQVFGGAIDVDAVGFAAKGNGVGLLLACAASESLPVASAPAPQGFLPAREERNFAGRELLWAM